MLGPGVTVSTAASAAYAMSDSVAIIRGRPLL
jgi:hypothetical protein